jgi:hypothetical protein
MRKHSYAQDRRPKHRIRRITGGKLALKARVEKRFQVNEVWVFATRYCVLKVDVRGFEEIEHRKVCTLAFVKTSNFFLRIALLLSNEFNPAMRFSIKDP